MFEKHSAGPGLIDFPVDDRKVQAYLSFPSAGNGKAVIVLQEWWGLVDHIKDICDRFSDEGFVAMAPDLYGGEKADGPDEAGRLMMGLKIDQTAKALALAAEFLGQHSRVESKTVGVIGFCMGGQLALLGASVTKKIGAAIDFYGIHPKVDLDASKINVPILGIFAEKDEFVPLEKAQALEGKLKEKNSQVDFHYFKGAGHAFFNDSRPEAFQADAAKKAWALSLQHFRKHL
jgi:carboxymethylenebutenolidase